MQSPLLGFNNNVRHKGRLFHIQTEDSGIKHPHVITHLFGDGGRILKTTKTSYAEHLGAERLEEIVRELMREQHKAMFIALRDGQLDRVLEEPPPSSRVAILPEKPKKSHRPPAPDPFTVQPADAAIEVATQAELKKSRPSSRPRKSDRPGRKSEAPRAAEKSARRYASCRPAAVFANPRSPAAGGSIFGGDDLISEQSLDEVILSYLAEDLDTGASKK